MMTAWPKLFRHRFSEPPEVYLFIEHERRSLLIFAVAAVASIVCILAHAAGAGAFGGIAIGTGFAELRWLVTTARIETIRKARPND